MTEMTGSRLRGSLTALVTPFRDGAFDEAAFRKFVRWQIEQGSHGLVPTGTTGESPTLTHSEHDRVVEACSAEAGGRVPVVAGAGSNSTAEAVARARHVESPARQPWSMSMPSIAANGTLPEKSTGGRAQGSAKPTLRLSENRKRSGLVRPMRTRMSGHSR